MGPMVINIDDESPPSFENNEYQWPGDCVKNTFDMYCDEDGDVISVLGPFDEDDQCHKDTGCTEQGVEVYATSPGTNHCSTREERNVDGQYDWMGGVPDDENVANNDDNRNSDISGYGLVFRMKRHCPFSVMPTSYFLSPIPYSQLLSSTPLFPF